MKKQTLRCIVLTTACALLPLLTGCDVLMEPYGAGGGNVTAQQENAMQTVMAILKAHSTRGYITYAEAAQLERYVAYFREEAEDLRDTADVANHNAGVYGSSPTMNSTQRMMNFLGSAYLRSESRSAAQTAKDFDELADSLERLLNLMRAKGRVR